MPTEATPFEPINAAYKRTFQPNHLSLGLVVPIEAYPHSAVPEMNDHIQRVKLAESLNFAAVWLRDVPFNVPSFGDAGQTYDPFVYLGALAATTSTIALGVASLILPLRHPAHVAKAAATADVLSDGRLLLGIASGDRPEEFPALNVPYDDRGQRFRDSYHYIRSMAGTTPDLQNPFGHVAGGIDLLPKPTSGRLPLLLTGFSQQSLDWVSAHGDGWITYPRPANQQQSLIQTLRSDSKNTSNKPVIEPLYVDLAPDLKTPPRPIHLGIHTGVNSLLTYLKTRERIGVNHIAINLRFNRVGIEHTLNELAQHILPHFSLHQV